MIAILASGALLATNACTSDETLGRLAADVDAGADPDSGTSTPQLPDADVVDGSADALDGDAAPRTCTDDGFCHVPLPEPQLLRGVWGDGTGVVWAVGDGGKILRWDGKVWAVHASVKGALLAIWGSGPTDIWIGGEAGILHGVGPSSSQLTFTAVPSDSDIPITSIHGFGPNDVWAVGGRSTWEMDQLVEVSRVLHYTGPSGDPAADWKLDPISAQVAVFSRVWGSSADDVWLGGLTDVTDPTGGIVLRGHADGNGGTAFEPVEVGTGRNRLYRIGGGTVLEEVFIAGEYRSSIGAVWVGPRDPSDAGDAGPQLYDHNHFTTGYGINAVWGSSKDDVWVAGGGGRVRHFDGESWSLARVSITKFPMISDLHGVWGKPKAEMWIVGDNVALRKDLTASGGGK